MLAAGVNLRPALVRGILPDEEQGVSDVQRFLRDGTLQALQPGAHRIILGRVLALNLGLARGDQVTLVVPRIVNGNVLPRYSGFTVAGIFEAGIQEHDTSLALVHMTDASDLKGLQGRAEGLAVRLDDPLGVTRFQRERLPAIDAALRRQLQESEGGTSDGSQTAPPAAAELRYSDWAEEHRNLFTAIHIEKLMMTIILMFIVGVAAFNIVASLMMVVIDKQKDIAILRTCGLEPNRVARIFLVQGSVIGLIGTVLGDRSRPRARAQCRRDRPVARDHVQFPDHARRRVLRYADSVRGACFGRRRDSGRRVRRGRCSRRCIPSRRAAAVAPAAALRYD